MADVSDWSTEASATTAELIDLVPVDSLTVTDVTAHSITVGWDYNGSGHTGFNTQYLRSGQDVDWVQGATLQPEARTFIQHGLPAEVEVFIRVVAVGSESVSAPVDVSDTTLPGNAETDLDSIVYYKNVSGLGIGEKWNSYMGLSTSTVYGSQDVTSLTSDRVGMDEIVEGDTAYGRWGFTYETPAFSLREGDEAWFRVFYLMPIGYIHYATSGSRMLKWFRGGCAQIATGFGTGTNGINIDWEENSRFLFYKESPTDLDVNDYWNPIGSFDGSTLYADGNWHSYEYYVLNSKDPAVGNAKLWIDGKLMGSVKRATITDEAKNDTAAGGPYHCNRLYFQTYWNGGAPQTQRAYFDNVAIAMRIAGGRDDTPYLAVDETGFPYIGSKIQ